MSLVLLITFLTWGLFKLGSSLLRAVDQTQGLSDGKHYDNHGHE